MKKAGFLLATLCLVVVAQAQKYELSCSKSELSIRWPSYESNSEYYICPRLFGKQLTVTCDPGQVFTFVLQSCTAPNRYIPPPGLDVLPTASPLSSKPNKDGYLTPLEITNIGHPPVLQPAVIGMPVQHQQHQQQQQQQQHQYQYQPQLQFQPQVKPIEIAQLPVANVETSKLEEIKPAKKEEPVVVVDEEPTKIMAPLPPTPAPTPPVVDNVKPAVAAGKKPAANKKKTSAKPSKNAKKGKNDKKTTKTDKDPKKSAKKTPKKPTKA